MIPSNTRAQDFYEQAWKFLDSCNLDKATELFLKDAEENDNPDAYIALAYIEELQTRFDISWKYYSKAIDLQEHFEPFLMASMHSPRYTENISSKYSGILELLSDMTENNNDGYLKSVGCERLGTYYNDHAQLVKALKFFREINPVTSWSLIGPFENISASGYYYEYPPEKEFNKSAKYKGRENKPVNWFDIEKIRNDGWVDFTYYFPDTNSTFYGNTFVYSDIKQKVQIRIGTSGSLRTFLNDQLILESYEETNNDLDTYIVETFLQKGWNRLLLKVGFSEINRCNFLVRITDNNGFEIKGLKFSTDEQNYTSVNNETATDVKSEIETFFEERLSKDPSNPINYLLLGEVYSLNDKSYKAETMYLKGIEKFPDNIIFPFHLFGRYLRDGKTSRANTILEKIDKRKDDIPLQIETKMNRELGAGNKEKFISLYNQYSNLMSDRNSWLKYKALYFAYQGLPLELRQIIEKAYRLFPDDFDIVSIKINIDYSLNKDFDSAISTMEKYCKNHSTYTPMKTLAGLYYITSRVDDWKRIYEELISYDPAYPGYYYEMSNTFYSSQDYSQALDYIKKAIEISPFNSTYYTTMGLDYLAMNNNAAAEAAFNVALKYSVTNYYARDMLKTIRKPDPLEDKVTDYNVSEIIASAPGKEKYPGKEAVILFDDCRSKLYSGGASETEEEKLIKALTPSGIDYFKNITIPYNSSFQELTIDKAVVIKQDGSEVEAEILGSQMVFNSLGVNDCVYYKYKIRNYFDGVLNAHYWDNREFSYYFPVENLRYSIIIPASENLYVKGLNMDDTPTFTKVIGDKKLYVWERKDIPGIDYEYYMPPLSDVGSSLYISTINDWKNISDWYYNLTRSKLRKHYEIENRVKELLEGKEELPVEEKIKIIYTYIIQNISYVYIPFLQSSFIPRNANDVLVNKMGDCKDVVTLFIAMLNEIDVDANYVLVNTINEGKNFNALPGNFFNHVIAVTNIDNQKQYYDLTATDYQCGEVPNSDKEAFALEINLEGSHPFYLSRDLFPLTTVHRNTDVTLNKDNSATLNVISTKTGDGAAGMRYKYKELTPELRLKSLSEILSGDISNFNLNSFDIENLDSLWDEVNYSFNFTIYNQVSKAGNYLIFKIPWNDALEQNPAFSYEKRNYPFFYSGYDEELESINIKLIEGFEPVEIPENVSLSCSVADFYINYEYNNGIVTAERFFKRKKTTVEPDEYAAFREFYNKVMEKEASQILLKRKKQISSEHSLKD